MMISICGEKLLYRRKINCLISMSALKEHVHQLAMMSGV